MGGFSAPAGAGPTPPVNSLSDVDRLLASGMLPPGRPSQALLDSLPKPPLPKPMTWVDDGSGEPVPPAWMKNPGRDWYHVVFDDGTKMTAAEYRAWRAENGVHAPPTAVDRNGNRLTPPPASPSPKPAPATPAPQPAPAPKPGPDTPSTPVPKPAPPSAPSAEDERRRRLEARTEAEAARRRTIATSWRGVLTPPPAMVGRRKTLLGE